MVSASRLDDELLALMRQAGFAVESGARQLWRLYARPLSGLTPLRPICVVRKAFQLGLQVVSYQILGLPNESLASMVQTLACNARLPVLLGASPYYQTPNSPIARGMEVHESDYVRARLTAMAIETPAFSRDDLYTLLVTTRIINFLKGLDLRHSVDLHTLMQEPWSDWRTQIGFTLLQRLAETRTLYFWTRHGAVANAKFKAQLLACVLQEAGHITCQNGAVITVRHWPGW
jgi:hypothetical protein